MSSTLTPKSTETEYETAVGMYFASKHQGYDAAIKILRNHVLACTIVKDAEMERLKEANNTLQDLMFGQTMESNIFRYERDSALEQVAALREDKVLLDDYEALRELDVQVHQVSEDQCEQELVGYYWPETVSVQSSSLRVAMRATIDAAKKGTP